MAQRYGGKYSPGAKDQPEAVQQAVAEDRRVDAAGAKANILFIPAVLVAFLSLNDTGALGPDPGLAAAAALGLAAWLTREGLRAEAAYNARSVARRPAFPRKIAAAILTGAGLCLTAWSGGNPPALSLFYGIAAGALHLGAFGLDPLRDKRMEGIDTFQQDRVARVVDEAEGYLSAIKDHIASLGDRALDGRIETFLAQARRMIRTVEEDPRDLSDAKKYLVIYLMGARDATVKFADLYRRQRDAAARSDYEALLTDLETNFAARTTQMLQGGREDMDLEIKVLRDRLGREGVRPE